MSEELQQLCSDSQCPLVQRPPRQALARHDNDGHRLLPDERSCGDSADGFTATMHRVETNNGHLVASDPSVLAYGSMLTIDGYAGKPDCPRA